ncbi:MAG: N-acetylgalactosamine 6-sulfate sulfatase [Planctomycetota bacterium]|nr:MAG: N-acetylgalactosamine 6-sulfate sulfatase [Planctomycetota bacterium]
MHVRPVFLAGLWALFLATVPASSFATEPPQRGIENEPEATDQSGGRPENLASEADEPVRSASDRRAGAARPDIVLIVADDLGWGDLSCYGAEDIRSPNLDRLAEQGQRWTHFYANCCVCSPTRASILTGCYPDRVGVPGVIRTHAENSWGKLTPGVPTLPGLLSDAGYQTAAVGKWHLGLEAGDHPLDRGFDFFQGFLGDMMDDYFNHLRHGNNYMRYNRRQINPAGHATSLFAQWACNAVNRMAAEDRPYFLYLAFNAPHTPIQPPAQALQAVQQRLPGLTAKRARLVALIEDLDAAVGRVLSAISATRRDTIVVFVSDNGGDLNAGANNGPLRHGKGSKYEGGLRVPAIFHWPGHIAGGQTCTAVGVTMDLLPTLCSIAGADCPDSIDGMPLNRWLADAQAASPPREIYFVRREGGMAYCGLTIEALRHGDWKLVHNLPTQQFELFDLAADPLEQHDRAAAAPQRLRELKSLLMRHIQAGGRVPWQP